MNAWADMASSVYPFLKFTIDIAEQHADNRLPVLDVSMSREGDVCCT